MQAIIKGPFVGQLISMGADKFTLLGMEIFIVAYFEDSIMIECDQVAAAILIRSGVSLSVNAADGAQEEAPQEQQDKPAEELNQAQESPLVPDVLREQLEFLIGHSVMHPQPVLRCLLCSRFKPVRAGLLRPFTEEKRNRRERRRVYNSAKKGKA